MTLDSNKQAATQFLELVIAGKIDEAYEQFVAMDGKHHNAYYSAGFAALKQGMKNNEAQFPNKKMSIKHVLGDGDLVGVHSHVILKPDDPGLVTLHLFRFDKGKITEMWDCGQPIPVDSPNKDGIF
jgi:predicted SnoaL-like aldol condensation-catalyzing enzyme